MRWLSDIPGWPWTVPAYLVIIWLASRYVERDMGWDVGAWDMAYRLVVGGYGFIPWLVLTLWGAVVLAGRTREPAVLLRHGSWLRTTLATTPHAAVPGLLLLGFGWAMSAALSLRHGPGMTRPDVLSARTGELVVTMGQGPLVAILVHGLAMAIMTVVIALLCVCVVARFGTVSGWWMALAFLTVVFLGPRLPSALPDSTRLQLMFSEALFAGALRRPSESPLLTSVLLVIVAGALVWTEDRRTRRGPRGRVR